MSQLSQYTDFFNPRINRNSLDFAFFSEIRWHKKFEKSGMDPYTVKTETVYPMIDPMLKEKAEYPGSNFEEDVIFKGDLFVFARFLSIRTVSISF